MYSRHIKRIIDCTVASIALIILAVPLLIVTVLIKLDSKGPALFTQSRYGKDKKPFTIYKFRSMATNAPSNRATSEFTDSHAYITDLGGGLRKLSIDELPQLINVVKGDMSLVGPRPLLEEDVIELRDEYGANSVRPGITGWAQANGRDMISNNAKARMDGEYANNISLRMDIKCILLTIKAVIYAQGHAEGHEQEQLQSNDAVVEG